MSLEIYHLTTKDYKVMPWKNGKGSTTELGIYPPDANVQDGFAWRISLADLDGSGPFSPFPGFDRVIVQVSGEPMILKHEGRPEKILGRYEPYSFAGEWPTENSLHGKAQDFNVMVRRGQYSALVESLRFETEAVRRSHERRGVTFVWVAYGSLQVHESSKGHDHRLDRLHALEIRGEHECILTLKPRETDTVAFLVSLSALPKSESST